MIARHDGSSRARWVPTAALVLLVSSSADAAVLGLRFAGGGSEITLGQSDSAVIEVVFQMTAADTSKAKVTGTDLRFEVGSLAAGVGGDYVLDGSSQFTVTGATAGDFPNWGTLATQLGPFNRFGFFLSVGDPAGLSGLVGDGTNQAPVVLASFGIRNDMDVPGDTYVVFRFGEALPSVTNGPSEWPRAFQGDPGGASFSLGAGNPGDADPRWAYHGYESLQPLVIHSAPEPGAAAFLALCGLLFTRRRGGGMLRRG